jgi:hypothetical protein
MFVIDLEGRRPSPFLMLLVYAGIIFVICLTIRAALDDRDAKRRAAEESRQKQIAEQAYRDDYAKNIEPKIPAFCAANPQLPRGKPIQVAWIWSNPMGRLALVGLNKIEITCQ